MSAISVPYGEKTIMVEYFMDSWNEVEDFFFYSPLTDKTYGPFVHKCLQKDDAFMGEMYSAIYENEFESR